MATAGTTSCGGYAKTGENMVWLGGHNDRAAALYTVQDQRWQVVGVGDFDGDRVDDILWRHSGNGSNTVWFSANVRDQCRDHAW
jgi:hypothetical protein